VAVPGESGEWGFSDRVAAAGTSASLALMHRLHAGARDRVAFLDELNCCGWGIQSAQGSLSAIGDAAV